LITRVSKIIHRQNKRIATLVTDKLKATDWDNKTEVRNLVGWINGITIPERDITVKQELVKIRQEVQKIVNG